MLSAAEQFWNRESPKYLWQAVAPRDACKPDVWDKSGPHKYQFIYAPVSRGNVSLWGFGSEEDRDIFCAWVPDAKPVHTPIRLVPSLDPATLLEV